MTEAEAYAKVKGMVDEYRAHPERFTSGHMVLTLTPKNPRRGYGDRVRVLPGVVGRLLCVNSGGQAVIDVEVKALERWLKNHRDWAAKPEEATP